MNTIQTVLIITWLINVQNIFDFYFGGKKHMYNKMYRLVNIINRYLSDMFLLQIVIIIIIITEPGGERA